MPTAFVNGAFLPLEKASVSVLDRGLLFADSVYEVIPVYAGQPFRLADHLARLANSLAGLRMPNPYTDRQWRETLGELVGANGSGDLSIYLQVTRGAQPRRDHRLPDPCTPTAIAFCQSRGDPDPSVLADGIGAITQPDTRWQYCRIKSTSLLANVMAADEARRAGATEAILIRDDVVLEGTSSNVFAVIDDRLVTPSLRDAILPGITRRVLLELAAYDGIDHAELDRLTPAMLANAQEIWITSSTREIFPVTRLDGAIVGTGRPGPLWTRMRARLQVSALQGA